MAIQRWDPRTDLVGLQEKMKTLFDEVLTRSAGHEAASLGSGWRPPMDLFEQEDSYVLRADLPGIAAGEVDIQVEHGTLYLRGERALEQGIARESYLRVERPHGRFGVQVALPPSVEQRDIRATHSNGVIEIVLPKRKAEAASKIEIASQ